MTGAERPTTSRAVGPTPTQLAVTAAFVGALGVTAGAGWISFTLVDVIVVVGAGLVAPLALGGRWEWFVVALAAVASLSVDPGAVAAALCLPWLATGAMVALAGARWCAQRRPPVAQAATVVAGGYSVVAGFAFLASRLGFSRFGIGEPVVELTTVHFTYAGCAALVLAARALDRVDGGWRHLGLGAVVLTGAAPVIVATGVVSRSALAQVGGAVAMAVGVCCTATLELRLAATYGQTRPERLLLCLSGVVVWLPMLLAVAWAAGQHWDFPALSIPAMERTHGVANSLGFVVAGLLAWWLAARAPLRPVAAPASAAPARAARARGAEEIR